MRSVSADQIGHAGEMTTESVINLERRDDGVAIITLTNGKVNPLSTAVLEGLHAIADELAADLPGAVIVTGGERIFAAGADISEFGGPEEGAVITRKFHDALGALAALPRMVIAEVAGYALGGGCELAMACDYRIASTKAVFGQPEILLGIIPGGGGTQRLPRIVGASRAKEISLSGRQVDAEEALRIGLADEVVEHEALRERSLELASSLAKGALVAQGLTKEAIDRGLSLTLDDGLAVEREAFTEVFRSEDSQIGVKSFLEHGPGKADFIGR